MTHQELCTLMFGSFLANEMEFEPVFGKPEDIHLTIYGSYRTTKSRATLTPQTAKQAVEGFLSVQNLDLFLENKYQPEIITRFRERMASETACLLVVTFGARKCQIPLYANSLQNLSTA